ncbi:hypothetical protein F5Y04DRAFT_289036 [Hypomontagnella monticulosa]|nr:hypothetical protein F5Y04DRAFT_289036 [Hypomontagnella monticulosa]
MPLKPALSALAKQTIKTAFEELERTFTPADSREFPVTTLDHVKKAMLNIENELAARRSLRHMRRLAPFLKGLEHYAKVMDILCNGTPYLSWIWAPITLILRIACEHVEAFDQLIKGYSRIGDTLTRFEILDHTFLRDRDFQQTLSIFYADILQFHKHAYKFVRRNSWALFFSTSWGRFQRRFDNIIEDLEYHAELIDKEAVVRNIAEARKIRQEIRTWREDSLENIRQADEQEASRQFTHVVSWLGDDESDQRSILGSILSEASEYAGTCHWILKHSQLQSWISKKPDTSFVWLLGAPGSGKSILSTQLMTFIEAGGGFVASHYCSDFYASSTKYEKIIGSLLIQLLRHDDELATYVYQQCVVGKKSPSLLTLDRLLRTLLSSVSSEPCQTKYIWIVIDGLDLCDEREQSAVISLANRISSKNASSSGVMCKILLSGRSSPTLRQSLRTVPTISLAEEKLHLAGAIKYYVSQRLNRLGNDLRQINIGPTEVQALEEKVTRKADGMFLYARLAVDYLSRGIFVSSEEIMKSVDELPKSLAEFYEKILAQTLIPQDPRSKMRIQSIFEWIAFAKRPLKKIELLSAMTFTFQEDPEFSRLAPSYMLDRCGPLIEERQDTTVTFVHTSVKEFLQKSSTNFAIHESDVLHKHGAAAVTCLLSGMNVFWGVLEETEKHRRVIKGIHAFHPYATEHWIDYILSHMESAKSTSGSGLIDLSVRLAEELTSLKPDLTIDGTIELDPDLRARLEIMRLYPHLHDIAKMTFQSRSLMSLELKFLQKESEDLTKTASSARHTLTGLLATYQETIRLILSRTSCPGITPDELETFKTQIRASTYTCQLRTCPRATNGFESEEACREHEMAHTQIVKCTFPTCHYPAFPSKQALENHLRRVHSQNSPRRSIRRVNASPPIQASLQIPSPTDWMDIPRVSGHRYINGVYFPIFARALDHSPVSDNHKWTSASAGRD